MKQMMLTLAALVSILTLTGCTTGSSKVFESPLACAVVDPGSSNMADVRSDRLLIWKASLNIQVWSISNAVNQSIALVERKGGFVEKKTDSGEASASLTVRVPAKSFRETLSGLESVGTVTYRNIAGEDVTEDYIDVEARLKNKLVLRDRLKQLLEKATEVKDILSIETELNRVQSDIDSMQGRIKSLKGQIEYATVTLDFERKAILGPLGYLCKGLWWGVEKLFVIRE
jgi:hypothetical protein